jgi:hypothetical protein
MPFRSISVPAARASTCPEKSALPKRQGEFVGHSKSQDLLLLSSFDSKREVGIGMASIATMLLNASSKRREENLNIIIVIDFLQND